MLCVCVCLGVAYMELLVVRSVQAGAHWNGGYSKGMVGGLVKEHITNEHIKFLTHFWFDSMLMLMFEQSFWVYYCIVEYFVSVVAEVVEHFVSRLLPNSHIVQHTLYRVIAMNGIDYWLFALTRGSIRWYFFFCAITKVSYIHWPDSSARNFANWTNIDHVDALGFSVNKIYWSLSRSQSDKRERYRENNSAHFLIDNIRHVFAAIHLQMNANYTFP